MNKFYSSRLLHICLHDMIVASKSFIRLQKVKNRIAFRVGGPADINFTSF